VTALLLDPFARHDYGAWRFLHRLNPLALLAATLPAIVALVVIRELSAPLVLFVLATLLTLVGAHVPPRHRLLVFGLPLAFVLVTSISFGIWVSPERVGDTPVLLQLGDYRYHLGSWLLGLGTALRLGAIFAIALIPGVASTGPDLVRAMVQQLRVPYRIGYTAFASFRFVPRFGHELAVIRAAHRVRGMAGGRGPIAALTRWAGYIVPLLAGAIRHAERVALAMDSRAFGAHRERTERYPVPFRARDVVFILLFWAATAAILVGAQPLLGLPIPQGEI